MTHKFNIIFVIPAIIQKSPATPLLDLARGRCQTIPVEVENSDVHTARATFLHVGVPQLAR